MKLILFLLAILFASQANAATCADRTAVIDRLETRYGEAPFARALSRSNDVMEVFQNETSETWSILLTFPKQQISCLVASGRGAAELDMFLMTLDDVQT